MGAPIVAKPPDPPRAPPRSATASSQGGLGSIECPHCGKSFTPGAAATRRASAASHAAAGGPARPVRAEPARSATKPAVAPAKDGRKTILVAEDTEFFLELVTEVLGTKYRTLGARTKTEALGLLGREPIDLVILDLSLEHPEDGLEVLANAAPRGLPCLIFTARNDFDLWGDGWTELQEKGATDLLQKGMNIEEQLLSKVAALLAGRN